MLKRLRIFAGPNGSGKSTIKKIVERIVKLGTYVNADDIKVQLIKQRSLDFSDYGISLRKDHFITVLRNSTWSERMDNVENTISQLRFDNNRINLTESYEVEDYFVTFFSLIPMGRIIRNIKQVYRGNGDVSSLKIGVY